MAVSGDFGGVSAAAMASHSAPSLRSSFAISRVQTKSFLTGGYNLSEIRLQGPRVELRSRKKEIRCQQFFGLTGGKQQYPKQINQEAESFLVSAVNMSFLERLNLAWKVLFPPQATIRNSNARIAKQRLKMILFSDRCAVSDEAKRKIVSNIVGALSDFVEIDSEEKVQLSVSTDSDLGTIYSVIVPVRRVKPEYQEVDEYGMITNVEYKDTGESSGSVDVKFDFFVPNE